MAGLATARNSNKCTPTQPYTYISIKLQEDLEMVVIPQNRVRGQSLEEHLMHGHCLLEGGQVLTSETNVETREQDIEHRVNTQYPTTWTNLVGLAD